MSDDALARTGSLAIETAVDVAWAQWSALTATAVPVQQPRVDSIVDPEALILLSLAVREQERRLDDLLAGWARHGAFLISVQRLKTLAKSYPEAAGNQVADFARYAAAGDRRWRRHTPGADGHAGPEPREKDVGSLRLTERPALMLRLRAGFGVGAKADLLTLLLGLEGVPAELKIITLAAGYSDRAMRTAAEEMALARFIQEIEGPPTAYRANPEVWSEVLAFRHADARSAAGPAMPRWRFWSVAFAFLTAVIDWHRQATEEGWSEYVASSRARDLMEKHRRRLRYTGVMLTEGPARGAAYLDAFRDIVEQVSTWAQRSLRE